MQFEEFLFYNNKRTLIYACGFEHMMRLNRKVVGLNHNYLIVDVGARGLREQLLKMFDPEIVVLYKCLYFTQSDLALDGMIHTKGQPFYYIYVNEDTLKERIQQITEESDLENSKISDVKRGKEPYNE